MSWLNYFPCGSYELNEKGEFSLCPESVNITQAGLARKQYTKFFKEGHTATIETFENYRGKIFLFRLILIAIVFFILISFKKKML